MSVCVTQVAHDEDVRAVTFRFSEAVQRLATEARRRGLEPPGFRAPPRLAGAVRTIRRPASGGSIVAVRLYGRPFERVAADIVDGLLVANQVKGARARELRAELLSILLAGDLAA